MNLRYRITVCAALLLGAALCTSYTVRGLRGTPAAVAAAPTAAVVSEKPESFTLCAKNGCVAVLDPACGAVVTDIELSTLREADRRLVEAGIAVASREELLALLEDLGS